MAEGFGEWDNTVTNPGNPQRRDTVWVQAAKDKDTPAYVVLQFDQDNPGVWPFHCTYYLPPLDLSSPPPSLPLTSSLPISTFFCPPPIHAYHLPPPDLFFLPPSLPSKPSVFLTIFLLHPSSLKDVTDIAHHRSHSLARIRRPLRQHPRTPRRHSEKHEDPWCNGAEL